ncbi:MAG: endonuclease/exonuclease/phosphatase family protein [Candidatus Thiodiazotropha sp.]
MKKSKHETSGAIMRTYRWNFHFSMLINMTLLLSIMHISEHIIFLNILVQNSIKEKDGMYIPHNMLKRQVVSNKIRENRSFSLRLLLTLILSVLITWLSIVLAKAGDVHPNPGPLSSSSSLSLSSSSSSISNSVAGSISSTLNQFHHLSFIHYNVQSIINKLDLLSVELSEFDILAFSETWLHRGISTNDLHIPLYNYPERKDRDRDPHGGVVIYVKESLNYKRRHDLELPGLECIWLELILQHKRLLFGLFYRPPNSDQIYHSLIEDSIHLAIDSGITDVIVTGDFNYNLLNDVTNRKIFSICQQFSMHQFITEPTHFTENSNSLLDIILVSNKHSVITCGVGDPFLTQDIRYHCPIYGILKFTKPKFKSFEREIWSYDRGDYDLLREKATTTNWDLFQDNDIDTYARNVTNHIKDISKQCIPNKTIRVRPLEPPWITSNIKKHIRKRKRLYRKAKITNNNDIWNKFRRLRNKTIALIRLSKQNHIEKLKAKLKSENLTSKDWWSTLKSFILPEKNINYSST